MPHPALTPDAVAVVTGGASGIGLAAAAPAYGHLIDRLAATVLALSAAAASYLPARRAAGTSPLLALRQE